MFFTLLLLLLANNGVSSVTVRYIGECNLPNTTKSGTEGHLRGKCVGGTEKAAFKVLGVRGGPIR